MSLFDKINALGATVVVVTHDLELVHQFDHRIVTIENGRIVSDVPARVRPSYDIPEVDEETNEVVFDTEKTMPEAADVITEADEAEEDAQNEFSIEDEDDRLELFVEDAEAEDVKEDENNG